MEELFNTRDQELVHVLKRIWKINELEFIGEYHHSNAANEKEFGYISNVYANDRQVFYPEPINKRSVSIRVLRNKLLIEGQLYKVQARIAELELRRQLSNPYLLLHDNQYPVVKETSYILPKDFIKEWFSKTGATPKDSATIASQLKLNSLELYTQTERFIFELIQNADDMPANSRGVKVELHLLNSYLLFRHNGKFFDRDDVKAIADAAKSNKSENVRQTGYKGIGFKSVFTDSNSVFIRSGSYSFKFDKNDPIYYDFKNLYSWQLRLLANSPRDLEQFEIDYNENKSKYENIDNIPWQIKPIWVNKNEFPEELLKSEFLKHAEVNIALEIGENVINSKNYAFMIESILSKPKFILFLRNTTRFDYYRVDSNQLQKQQSIELKEKDNLIDISHNDFHVATFSKIHFDVEINNDEFRKAGFSIEKFEEKAGVFKFKDEYGEIKSIPEKLGLLSSTRMTFASQIKDNEVVKLDKSHSILYNYLPTSDQRFGFPFLINADFITNTSREFILKENKWNQYLMYHIGKNCVECLYSLCNVQERAEGKVIRKYVKTYLSLLPESLLNEDDEELSEINKAFNLGFLSSVNQSAFIVNMLGEVKNTSEIIIDETRFSKVLNPDIFKIVSETKKVLPASEISNDFLNKDYLKIEKYTADKLTLDLHDKNKQNTLAKALSSLDSYCYKRFLEWLDQYYHLNDVKEEWVLQLPIIRQGELIISLTDAIGQKDFVFKTAKTFEIENILQKLGFILSEFSLDEESVKYIKQVLLTKESHLQSDKKLYNHITSDRDLSVLQPYEKNTILNFFKGLYNIGPSDYAASLKLFQSQTRKASALNKLISNKEIERLPKWLLDFVILESEELEISSEFQKELLIEKDLLEKLFCNTDSFNEIIVNINAGNIDDFYKYLLKLNNEKTEGQEINKSVLWIYIESTLAFVQESVVYMPESFAKIKDPKKYSSIKSIIETISAEKLPHFSALQIKAPFALGGKDLKLTEISPKQNSFDIIILNDFLDWTESNGEKDLLNHFSFLKIDEKFSIGKVSGTQYYYTNDASLIAFIQASDINTKLCLFPNELYNKERNKIGLLEGIPLFGYLLEKRLATTAFAKFIQAANDSSLTLQYLELLTELNIDSSKSYTIDDAEFKILKLVSSYLVDDLAKLDSFREKISLDGVKLLDKAISADVKIFDAHNKFKYQFQSIELSDILPAYKGKTYPVSEIVELFIDFTEKKNLREIFKATPIKSNLIIRELTEIKLTEALNAAQASFLSFYKWIHPDEAILENKVFFSLNPEANKEDYEKELHQFLENCLNEDSYTEFINQGILANFNPILLISDKEHALEKEQMPFWLVSWLEKKSGDDVLAFIAKMGVKSSDSQVVQLRKGLLGDTKVNIDAARGGITEPELIINTFEWLITNHKEQYFTNSLLKPLYERALALEINIDKLALSLPADIDCKTYKLYQPQENEQYHLIWSGWKNHEAEVWAHIKSLNHIIIDELMPDSYLNQLNPTKLGVSIEIDREKLQTNLRDCNLSFYKYWPEKDNYIIKIFKGSSLPRKVMYNNSTVKSFLEGYCEKFDSFYVVAESIENSIPHSIKDFVPEFFDKLNSWKSDFENNRTPRKLSPEEEEAIMKLFDGIVPEEFRKNINLAALASALVYLDGEGFDVLQANKEIINTHVYAQLAPVFKDGVQYTVMCRSARLGLLYLTKQAWDRLDNPIDPNVMLFADKGYGESDLFRTKQDVLDVNKDNPTDFQLIRIESRANAIELDEMLQGKFEDASRLWIIFRLKDNEHFDKLFFDKPETNNNPLNTANIRTEDTGGY